ncbi:MAG TPA: hypothetical protein VG502_08555 [Flexivirga sp.]|uniref:hypothetical protein n=1 Tax=Flexivirga sp. TaxID=1962927 RepID=UPI002BBF04E5|nr:hypothetical protein [Flexivirga sp.]HWC22332.1 hypothetical protein [Flexivirga sp.]
MTTERETRRRTRLGLVGLLVAVGIGMMVSVTGGLHSSSRGYESVRLEPGASVALVAHHQVALDSGDGITDIKGCSISGPGTWSRYIVAAGRTTDFRTGPKGDYEITCKGGAVEVEDDAGGHPAAGVKERHGNGLAIGLVVLAGLVGLVSIGMLIAAARGRRNETSGDAEPGDSIIERTRN